MRCLFPTQVLPIAYCYLPIAYCLYCLRGVFLLAPFFIPRFTCYCLPPSQSLDRDEVYVWIDASCLPNNVRPAREEEAVSAASKGLAVAEAVAAADAAEVQTEGQVCKIAPYLVHTLHSFFLFFLLLSSDGWLACGAECRLSFLSGRELSQLTCDIGAPRWKTEVRQRRETEQK